MQNPFLLIFPEMLPGRGVLLEPGAAEASLDASYSSLFKSGGDELSEAWLDGELLRTRLGLRLGLADGLEAAVELPWLYASGGFLDGFITGYHDALGFSQGGRGQARDDQFLMRIEREGRVAFDLEEDRAAIGDLPVGLAVCLHREGPDWPALALRGLIELPTGDLDRGFGSGELDAGLQMATEKGFDGWVAYGDVSLTANRTPPGLRRAGMRAGVGSSAMVGAEVPLGRGVAGIGQIGFRTSPIRGLDLSVVRDDAVTLTLGGTLDLSPSAALRAGFTEDLYGGTAVDITVHLGLQWSF